MEVSGQLNAPAALCLGKEQPVPNVWKAKNDATLF